MSGLEDLALQKALQREINCGNLEGNKLFSKRGWLVGFSDFQRNPRYGSKLPRGFVKL